MRTLTMSVIASPALALILVAAPLGPAFGEAGTDLSRSWRADSPGTHHVVDAGKLPAPYATRAASNGPSDTRVPQGALPKAPPGFAVTRYKIGLEGPREIRVAPNGDVFVSETAAGQIHVLRSAPGATIAASDTLFASDLDQPFGLAFYPPGPDPRWVYVADTNSVVRFPYRSGEGIAAGKPETVVAELASSTGGHTTRDIRFSPDGARLFVSVGSGSNVADGMPRLSAEAQQRFVATHPLGATWGDEAQRADVLSFTPDGGDRRIFATGLRNCVGLALQPKTDALWCAVNERDGLGDDLVPDYVTSVRQGAFYGWPWYYFGAHEDPRLKGARPDLASKASLPDVPLQSHSAALQIAFYAPKPGAAAAFPAAYDGDAFVSLHGSWNRALRTGYKVIRVTMKDGKPTGGYDDFLTGFVQSDDSVWGRPVGVAVAADGALLVGEDANGVIYRVAPAADHAAR